MADWLGEFEQLVLFAVLHKAPDGNGYELVCAPENEAAIYAQALTLDLWPKAAEFGGPVKLIGCDPELPSVTLASAIDNAPGCEVPPPAPNVSPWLSDPKLLA
jgi:hypothetical protein